MKEYIRSNEFKQLIESIPIENCICTEQEAENYLLILNRTWWNNLSATDIFNYEKIIFLEEQFPNNQKIQTLIKILKENIAKNYKLKQQYLSRLLDSNLIDPEFNHPSNTVGFSMHKLYDSILYSQGGPYER